MTRIRVTLLATLVVAVLALAPLQARAQEQATGSSFDALQAAALSAGLIVGSTAAVIVTDGLILPVVSYATGGPLAYGGGGYALVGNSVVWIGHTGYMAARSAASIFGAVSGVMLANEWYGAQ
jgi:hypothetical protein